MFLSYLDIPSFVVITERRSAFCELESSFLVFLNLFDCATVTMNDFGSSKQTFNLIELGIPQKVMCFFGFTYVFCAVWRPVTFAQESKDFVISDYSDNSKSQY